MAGIEEIIAFWFAPTHRALWYRRDAAFDRAVGERLGDDHRVAAAGGHDDWLDGPRGCLALAILLDQVPRNLYRDDARAFACDARARAVARHALAEGFDRQLDQLERAFLYLPLEHSEDLADQEDCCLLMATLDQEPILHDYALRHREIIARFGRFPHRNAVLGRETTAEEAEFLEQPGSSF